jgi:hypothetical protein
MLDFRQAVIASLSTVLVACGGGGGGGGSPAPVAAPPPPDPAPPSVEPALFSLSRDSATLFQIDPETGASLESMAVTLSGQTLDGGRGLTADSESGQLFGAFQLVGGGSRLIASIDPGTGIATQVSTQAGRAAALAFDNDGTLYTGEAANTGANFANRLFVIDTVSGDRTEFMPIANSEAGIALALNPIDGQIYHLSGSLVFGTDTTTPVFERIDTAAMTRVEIPVSGDDIGHVRAMTFNEDGNFLVVSTFDQFGPSLTSGRYFQLTTDGVATELGSMDHISKGIAFIPPVSAPVSFSDVQVDHWAHPSVEKLSTASLATACDDGNYCPDTFVSRAELAMFLEYVVHGTDYVPPEANGNLFDDVGVDGLAVDFIEHLYLDGIVSGCGGSRYCPDDRVTNGQIAELVLKAKHGAGYLPLSPVGIFYDVDLSHPAAGWVEQLSAEEIYSGCGGGNYCPDDLVTRAQLAVIVAVALRL